MNSKIIYEHPAYIAMFMFLCYYTFMRTTIDLPEQLFRRVKAAASLKGMTLKKFITRALEHEIETHAAQFEYRNVSFPLVPSDNPGTLEVDAETIAAALDQEDHHVPS